MKEKVKAAPSKFIAADKVKEFFKEKRTSIIYGAVYGVIAYLFGGAELIFETAPLGLAFVCAAREGIPFAAAGLIISAVLSGKENTVMTLSGLIVALGFRYALSFVLHRKEAAVFSLRDGLAPRISSAAAGSVTISLIRIIYGGFRYYDLLAAAFFILCACGAVYAYSLFSDAENKNTEKYEAGLAAMMFSVVISLKAFSLFGVSLSAFAAFALTLGASRRGGALRGVASGFLCGAAVDISLCPMFGAVGFLCGLLAPLSAYIGVLFSVAAGLFIGMQTGGFSVITSNLPEAAAASCAVLAAEYFGAIKRINGALDNKVRGLITSYSETVTYADALEKTDADAKKLADALKSISELTADISASERRPDKKELCSSFEEVFEEFCFDCKNRYECFPLHGKAEKSELLLLCGKAKEKRTLDRSDLPENVRNVCRHADVIPVKLNIKTSEYIKKLSVCDKAGVVSSDYAALSKMLYAKRSHKDHLKRDPASEKALSSLPYYRELFRGDIAVCGERKKQIVASGADIRRIKQSCTELKTAAEKALKIKLTAPEITTASGLAVLRTESAPVMRAEVNIADKPKAEEIVNGDTAFYTECDDRLFCTVCDGMGSGKDAAAASRLSGIVLGRLLYAGCDRAVTLETLNQIIRQRRAECFSTVDMLEADLLSGEAAFYKCGASPSFVLRKGKVYRIASHTPPVGIMKELCAEKVEFKLLCGDVVVMVSDGITGSSEDAPWINGLLGELDCTDPALICDTLIEEAEKRYGCRDDMTVLAVRLCETV
ncbi:MAG: SpoIIE family protein phosphatase [Clostridia bacterium]|nr:SpoIIE family protein phosphatase [Clostridia bacterium]